MTSDNIDKIAPALLAAQKRIKGYSKDSTNPHYKSRYASLESTLAACKDALNDNGISILQPVLVADGGHVSVATALIHESGQWLYYAGSIPCEKPTPQAAGSAITYLRRYGLQAVMCLAEEDDDAEAAQPQKPPFGARPVSVPRDSGEMRDELAELRQAYNNARWAAPHLRNHLLKNYKVDDIKKLTKPQQAELLQTLIKEAADAT